MHRGVGGRCVLASRVCCWLSEQAVGGQLVPHLTEQFRFLFGEYPSRSEVRSWERSIPALLGPAD